MATQKYIPELDYWFTNWWNNRGDIKLNHIYTSELFDYTFQDGSVLELLFSETFPYENYHFGFKSVNLNTMPPMVIDRLGVMYNIPDIYVSDPSVGLTDTDLISDGTNFDTTSGMIVDATSQYNVLRIRTEDIPMLDALFRYKHAQNPMIDNIVYSSLTNLSKMIYAYLLVKIHTLNTYLDDIMNLTNLTKLEEVYRLYILNECHKIIKSTSFLLDSGEIELSPVRLSYKIEDYSPITISPPLPYSTESVVAHLNNIQLQSDEYNILEDGTNMTFHFDNSCPKLYTDYNYLVLDYPRLIDARNMTGYDSTCMYTNDSTSDDVTILKGIAPEPGDQVI